MSKKIAVILSGCGHKDGTEITEAVSTLIAITEAGASYEVFAPDFKMAESALISRGVIRDLKELKAADFDGVVYLEDTAPLCTCARGPERALHVRFIQKLNAFCASFILRKELSAPFALRRHWSLAF